MNYLSKLKKIVFAFAILFSFGYFTNTALAVSDDVTVIVTRPNFTLSINTSGNGSGTVSGAGSYASGTTVTAGASANTGSYFAGWSGDCNSSGQVTMYSNMSCTATFTLNQYALTVTKSGTGSGTVTSSPSGISCGSDCTENYNYNTSVTLTASASTGSYFAGWSGACSGTSTCTVTMTAAKNVTATFTLNQYTVTGNSDVGGTITPSSRTVYYGDTTTFTVGATAGYAIGSVSAPNCSGSLSGSTYTTGAVTQNCTVTHYPTLIMSGTLSSSASSCVIPIDGSSCSVNLTWTTSDPIGTSYITASGMTSVSGNSGTNVAFTVPYNTRTFYLYNSEYQLAYKTVTSSCATGSTWNSSQGKCARNSYTVSTSAGTGGSISPTSASVAYNSTTSFTVTPNTGYSISSVTGCGGTRSGNTYTTGAITAACTVTASFSLNSYTVSTSNTGCNTVNPTSATVNHGSTTSFAITPGTGRYISSTSGCSGSLSSTTYTTGAITAACTVSMSCPLYTYTVSTSAGTGGAISAAQTINYGSTASITVTPNTGYSIASVTGCSGTLSGNTYTTGAITANCTVSATFTDGTAPAAPGAMTTSWTGDHWVKTSFTASTTGSTDSGSGMRGYRLCRSADNTTGCYDWVAAEGTGTTVSVSGAALPPSGSYRYYYWYAYDNAGNQSSPSTGVYVRMDSTAPVFNSVSFTDCNYENGDNCYVKNGTTFYVNISHTDNQSGTNRQYFELSKDGTNRGTWDGTTGNIKSSAIPYGVSNGSDYTGFSDGSGMSGTGYLDIQSAQCIQTGNCNSTALGKWKVVAGSGESTMYGVTVYMYDYVGNGVGDTATPKYVYLDNTVPTTPTPTDAGANQASTSIAFTADPTDAYSGISTCYAQIDVNNTDGTSLAMDTTDIGADGDHTFTGSAGNTYYYRYYCTDKVGNSSGWSSWTDGISINVAPTVTTPAHTSVSLTSATLGATVTSAGVPASLIARGTCWGTSAAPTTNCAAEGGTTVSSFSHSRTGLTPSTTYYYRGYATNSTGTSYSADNTFTTSAVTVSAVNATTSYNATVGSSVSFAYTMPTTNISSVQCQLLDNASTALTSYATTNPIVYTAPSTPGSFGYYIRCRNATYTGTTSTSSLITVNIPSPTGSISASPTACSIPVDGSSCSTTIFWSTTNPVNTSTVVSGGTTLYTANSGSQSVSIPYGSRTFTLNNNGAQIGTVTPTSSCVTGSTWNSTSGTCVINTYTVSATAGTGGTISPTSTVVNYGSTTLFTITPSTGYSISSASGCGGTRSGNTYTTGTITANCTVSVSFSLNSYTVSTSAGTGGSITPTSIVVPHGEIAVFYIIPDAGYSISASGCGGSMVSNTHTYRTAAMTGNCTVSASFSLKSYTLNYSAGSNGTISGTANQTVNYGSNATVVTAVPNTGYHFTGWSEGGLHKFTVGSSTFVVPEGINSVETLVVAGGGGGGGSTAGGGGGGGVIYNSAYSVTPNSNIDVTVGKGGFGSRRGNMGTPNNTNGDNSIFGSLTAIGGGYGFSGYTTGSRVANSGGSGGGAGYYSGNNILISSPGSGTSGQGYSGGTVTATSYWGGAGGGGAGGAGSPNTSPSSTRSGGVGVQYDISGISTYYGGGGGGGVYSSETVSPGGLGGGGKGGSGTPSIAEPGMTDTGGGGGGGGYHQYGPGGGGGGSGVVIVKYPITTAARQDTSVTLSRNITASFEINTYTVSATAGTGGTISPTSTVVNYGSTTSFTLTPNTGYHINTVSGCGGTRSGNTYTTAAIAGDCTVSATFALDTFALSVSKAGTGTGTVTSNPAGINCGSTCSYTYDLGTSVTLTATPDIDGNIFTGWSGACTGTSTCTVTMSAVKSVTATFNAVTISVTPTATTYYVARGANNTFGFTSTTSTGTTECRLLNSTSTALTNYATGTSITYAIPSTAGAYGYYIQCRNVSYPTKIATSSLITVNAVSVSVSATTSYSTTPGSSVSFAYTPSTTAGATECALLNNTQTAITSYQAASPIVYAIPNNVGTYGYYVRCRHTIATTETATSSAITVTSACATGTSWNGSSCVAPTGTLTSSNCSISAGNNTCSTSLNWSTSNPIGTSAVTTNYPTSGTTVSSQNSGTNVAYTIPYGSTTFYLYNNAIQLSQSTATASCASGTVWNTQDGKCQATTGTIQATGCTINAGSSSCSSAITWSTLNPYEATSTVKTSGGTTVSTGLNGSINYSVNPGTHTFNLWHYGSTIASASATVVCSSLSEWNGSVCELKAPEIMTFTASQSNVVRGRPTTLVWESEPDATCTGTNFETGGLYTGTVSVNPTVDTTYTLSCVRGTKTTTKSITIKMLDISIIEQ